MEERGVVDALGAGGLRDRQTSSRSTAASTWLCHDAGHVVFGPAEAFTPEQLAELYDINAAQAAPAFSSGRWFAAACLSGRGPSPLVQARRYSPRCCFPASRWRARGAPRACSRTDTLPRDRRSATLVMLPFAHRSRISQLSRSCGELGDTNIRPALGDAPPSVRAAGPSAAATMSTMRPSADSLVRDTLA